MNHLIQFPAVRLLLLTGLMLVPATLNAQDAKSGSKHQAWVVMSGTARELNGAQIQITGSESHALPQSKRSVIGPIKVAESASLRITPQNEQQALLNLKLPPAIKKMLIILTPVSNEDKTVSIDAIVKDMDEFSKGGWLFVNLADAEFRVQLGEDAIELKRGENRILKAASQAAQENKKLSFEIRNQDSKKWELMSTSNVSVLSTRREILFFTNDPLSESATYHAITLSE